MTRGVNDCRLMKASLKGAVLSAHAALTRGPQHTQAPFFASSHTLVTSSHHRQDRYSQPCLNKLGALLDRLTGQRATPTSESGAVMCSVKGRGDKVGGAGLEELAAAGPRLEAGACKWTKGVVVAPIDGLRLLHTIPVPAHTMTRREIAASRWSTAILHPSLSLSERTCRLPRSLRFPVPRRRSRQAMEKEAPLPHKAQAVCQRTNHCSFSI